MEKVYRIVEFLLAATGISRLFILDDNFFTKDVIVVGFSEHTNKIINQWKQ